LNDTCRLVLGNKDSIPVHSEAANFLSLQNFLTRERFNTDLFNKGKVVTKKKINTR